MSTVNLLSRRSMLSSSILLAENFVRLGLVALVSFWIARSIGPERFGVLNYASALVMVFLSVASLGLETPLVLRLARQGDGGALLGSAIGLRLLSGLACAAAAVATVALARPGDGLLLMVTAVAALSIPLSAPLVLDSWFKAHDEALRPASARLLATMLSCAAKGSCLLLGLGVVALAWTVALEAVLMALALLWAYAGAVRRDASAMAQSAAAHRLTVKAAPMRELLRGCGPYVLSIGAVALYMKIDIVLLGMLSTHAEVGLYSLCQKISEVLYILPVVVVDVLFPQLTRHPKMADAASQMQAFFDATLAVAWIGTLLAIVVVQVVVPLWIGEAYRRSAELFQWHAFSCIGIAMAHARFKWMAAVGLQRFAPLVTVSGLALAVLLHLLFIPRWGALGAAMATVLAYYVSGHLASFLVPALRPVAMLQTRALWPWARLLRGRLGSAA